MIFRRRGRRERWSGRSPLFSGLSGQARGLAKHLAKQQAPHALPGRSRLTRRSQPGDSLAAARSPRRVDMNVRAGDVIEIPSNKVDQPPRRGTVQEVMQAEPLKIEVRWEDGHLSIFEPMGGSLRVLPSE
ncbi:MAG: DUF1918 domain-containing protein [Actinomycetota bacterium]|nr:DUF1918 domain-containing protein [Actinomycetota bacterium]